MNKSIMIGSSSSSSISSGILFILFFGIYLSFIGISSTSWKVGKTGNGQLGLEKLCAQINFLEYEFCNLDLKITDDNYLFYTHYLTKYHEIMKTDYKQKLFTRDQCESWANFVVAIWLFCLLTIFLNIITFQTILKKHDHPIYPTSKYLLFTTFVLWILCLITSLSMTYTFGLTRAMQARGFDLFFAYCYLSFVMFSYGILRNFSGVKLRFASKLFFFDGFACMLSFVMLILITFAMSDGRWMIMGIGGRDATSNSKIQTIDPYFFAGMDSQVNEMFKVSGILPNETLAYNEVGFFAPSVATKHTSDPYQSFFVNNFLSLNLAGVSYCKDILHKFDQWASVPLFKHNKTFQLETFLYIGVRIFCYSIIGIYILTIMFMVWDNLLFDTMKKRIVYFGLSLVLLMIIFMELFVSITKTKTGSGYYLFIIGCFLYLFALYDGNFRIHGVNSNKVNICRKNLSFFRIVSFPNVDIQSEQNIQLLQSDQQQQQQQNERYIYYFLFFCFVLFVLYIF
jgi:hypothetical protein